MDDQLIVYYSRNGENYVNGELKELEIGQTEKAAFMIAKLTGALLFKLEQLNPYAKDYNTCIQEARDDANRNARPALKAYPDLNGYQMIYLGFPNYWGTMPMAVFTFLENYDLSDKTIKPFITHEGSGFGHAIKDLEATKATLLPGLAIKGSQINQCEKEIEEWLGE